MSPSKFKVGEHWRTTQNELYRVERISHFGIFAKNVQSGYTEMFLETPKDAVSIAATNITGRFSLVSKEYNNYKILEEYIGRSSNETMGNNL